MAEAASASSTTLGGYSHVRDIGSGSYGRALLVKDSRGGLHVLKAIDISRLESKERRDAVNEVRVLSGLKHPYVVAYRESFLDGRFLCIVMDYAEGGDLYTRIMNTRTARQTFPQATLVRWFTQAALALKHFHQRLVLHRDLKSQNLFLTASGRVRVGDFGIAKVLENTAAFAKTTIGTPYYLSPEICREQPYSWSSDVWALGCILWEMAALKVPFDGPNLKALVTKITRGPTPAFPSRYQPELAKVCSDLLQRDERKRPNAADILKFPIVQWEIRNMLNEEQAKRIATDVDATPSCPYGAPARSEQPRVDIQPTGSSRVSQQPQADQRSSGCDFRHAPRLQCGRDYRGAGSAWQYPGVVHDGGRPAAILAGGHISSRAA